MTYSIYHFFDTIVQQKQSFKKLKKLDQFPFDKKLLSCRNDGVFPDLAIRLNKDIKMFTGGELIELKDSDSYTVSHLIQPFHQEVKRLRKSLQEKIVLSNDKWKRQVMTYSPCLYGMYSIL